MDPLTDFDRALREALKAEPGGDLGARIRTRVATAPGVSPSLIPTFTIAALTCALLAVVAAGIWRETTPLVSDAPVLAHRDLTVLSDPPRVFSSPSQQAPQTSPAPLTATNVVVSRSEMLALQRLFAGITVAPAPSPVAEELLIPELTIEPIAPFPAGPEGERQ